MAGKVCASERHAEIVVFWHVPTEIGSANLRIGSVPTMARGWCIERVAKDTYCRILHSQPSELSERRVPASSRDDANRMERGRVYS